jgi:class I fructose-bisphosphate aldolase
MELSEPIKRMLSFYESDNPGTKANLAAFCCRGSSAARAGVDLASRSERRARAGAQLCAKPAGLRPTLPLPAGDRCRTFRLCRTIDISTPTARIRHVVQSAFNGRRIVVFSGGDAKDLDGVFAEVHTVRDGGGNGSIIGRNTFQRSKKDATDMLSKIVKIYQGKD